MANKHMKRWSTSLIIRNANQKNMPVVIFSSLVSTDNEKKCKAVGADAQITKPQLDELVVLIDELIAKSKSSIPQLVPA